MTPTIGATYETTRGTFKVISRFKTGLLAERPDGRHILLTLSDWLTWRPTLVADTQG